MILIKNAMVANPKSSYFGKSDMLLSDGKIVKMGESMECPDSCEVIDAAGCIVAPGLIDVHTHFRDPGFCYKEDIETGARAAAAGGYTTVIMMANTKPVIDNEETLSYVLKKGRQTGIHVETCAAVTKNLAGQEMTDMERLRECGAIGFTDDGIPLMDCDLVKEAMRRTTTLGVPISFHEENKTLIFENGINAGTAASYYGIKGSPREAEISMVKRDLPFALETGATIDIQHISTAEAVELVRRAKETPNHKIYAEATPQHFSLTQEAVIAKGSVAKVNPPLREEKDRLAIIEGLRDGTIDVIATDHAPHSKEEKDKPITDAPSGMIGLETALALANTKLVKEAGFDMLDMLAKFTCNPAAMYGLDRGSIEVGKEADLVIFDPNEEWIVEHFQSKAENSPFIGETLHGKVKKTICSGKVVYSDKGTTKE